MLKGLSNNRAGRAKRWIPCKVSGFLIGMVLLVGCSYITQDSDMTEWDYKLQQQGFTLECTDYRDERCVVVQWINAATADTAIN